MGAVHSRFVRGNVYSYMAGTIKGQITNSEGAPLYLANVAVLDGGGAVVAGVMADELGSYEVPRIPGTRLRVSFIGYQTRLVPVASISDQYDVVLPSKTYELPTVEITPEKKPINKGLLIVAAFALFVVLSED